MLEGLYASHSERPKSIEDASCRVHRSRNETSPLPCNDILDGNKTKNRNEKIEGKKEAGANGSRPSILSTYGKSFEKVDGLTFLGYKSEIERKVIITKERTVFPKQPKKGANTLNERKRGRMERANIKE
jgi:hypothetical protein